MCRPDIHCFVQNGKYFVLDINTCETMEINPVTYQVLQLYGTKNEEDIINLLSSGYSEADVKEVLTEIEYMKEDGYFAPYKEAKHRGITPSDTQVSHPLEMVLLVSQQCNMGCKYCFAGKGEYGHKGKMTEETAIKAVDYLMERSEETKKRMHINFFGGEPLLNFPVIKKTAEYLEEIYQKKGIRVTMGITTNGTIMNNQILDCLRRHNITVVVSIDGPKDVHDKWRKFRNGKGTYDAIVKNVRRMNESLPKKAIARVTVTKQSPPIEEISKHIKDIGFANMVYSKMYEYSTCNNDDYNVYKDINLTENELKDFYNSTCKTIETIINKKKTETLSPIENEIVMRDMHYTNGRGPRRFNCSACVSLIAVGIEGELYPCQRFIDMPAFKMGDVWNGLDGERFAAFFNDFESNRMTCTKCWGRNLCGRDCFRDAVRNDCCFGEPDKISCEIKLKGYERQLYLQSEVKKIMPDLIKNYIDPRSIK